MIWEEYYPGEPFDHNDLPPPFEEDSDIYVRNNNSAFEYNIEEAALRQKDFYYQVSMYCTYARIILI